MDPNSETESEPSVDVCEASRIAYLAKGSAQVLCAKGCRDTARQEPVYLLAEDAAISDVRDLPEDEGTRTFRACPFHAGTYESQRAPRKCARSQCYREKTVEKEGFSLCAMHAADRTVGWRSRSTTPQREEAGRPEGPKSDRKGARKREAGQPKEPAGARKGSPAKEEADRGWLLHICDPQADDAAGWDAYYSFPARFVGPAPESTPDDPRTNVEAVGMGLTFSIPDGALVAPRPELLDEFISTRPPAICWRAGAALRLSDYGDGTNYQGDGMSPSSAIALSPGAQQAPSGPAGPVARHQGAEQERHALARRFSRGTPSRGQSPRRGGAEA